MGATSKYPFYVELSSADGLMLGQHVYMELASGETATGGLWLPEYYLCYEEPAGGTRRRVTLTSGRLTTRTAWRSAM